MIRWRPMVARLMLATFSATVSVHLMVVSGAAQEPCRDAGKEPYPCVAEGPRVGGKPHGAWVLRYTDGDVAEGPYVYGKRDGDWVIRGADGTLIEAPFADGKPHGVWVWRYADGTSRTVRYTHGKPMRPAPRRVPPEGTSR